ncbi:crotonase/enoyl-CoA hydratase family protein [Rhodopila globiformis]|uniref:crotonase/enoyl-CoA hydratase family protein n=1 Tax=Rhodopila globiformis TaxID=1071 RepID=UPI0013048A3C|nr:crotonase/enoyl-CoA hydratase family protein [Rhodopila globiformis]
MTVHMNALALRRSVIQSGSLDSIVSGEYCASTSEAPSPLAAPQTSFSTIDVTIDPATEACWCHMQPKGRPSFTLDMLRDLGAMQDGFRHNFRQQNDPAAPPFRFFVMASRTPGVFNLGGDLAHFAACIRAKNDTSLRRYAYATVASLYANLQAYDQPVVTIALIQGDALGGGFEAALSFDIIVAEKGARFGFPEILFNLFPGMGAFSLLSRRIGAVEAERLILSGDVITAEELHRLGAVDLLVESGCGEAAVRDLIAQKRRRHNAHVAFYRARRRVQAVTHAELQDVVDIWVEAALQLTEADVRKMERLAAAQERRSRRLPAALDATA